MKGQRQEVWGETGISREVAELGAGGGGGGGYGYFLDYNIFLYS